MTVMPTTNLALIARIDALAQRAREWMLDCAFPFWAEHSVSPEGGFFERLDLQGCGIAGEPSRVRLQARMVFTFALAAELGWDRARASVLVDRGIATLLDDCRRKDGLFGRIVQPGTGLVDDTAQAYDTAFALLAFATAGRVLGNDRALLAAKETGAAIDAHLLRPEGEGGYCEELPPPSRRSQNPHMHLTEASLAAFAATGERSALDRAASLSGFVRDRFFDEQSGLLLEHDGGVGASNHVEAGHMFEWVWILGELGRLSGQDQSGWMQVLHRSGMQLLNGLDFLPLSQECDGSVREARQRTWGPTEKLKAHIALWRVAPSRQVIEWIDEATEMLFADHVDRAIPGAWIDSITPDRKPLIEDITPATGYHIFLAFKELIALSEELKA